MIEKKMMELLKKLKIAVYKSVKVQNGEQYEKCVLCDELTSVRKEQPIEYRDFYIPGCGQLCYDCYHKIYPGAENMDELPADECR